MAASSLLHDPSSEEKEEQRPIKGGGSGGGLVGITVVAGVSLLGEMAVEQISGEEEEGAGSV